MQLFFSNMPLIRFIEFYLSSDNKFIHRFQPIFVQVSGAFIGLLLMKTELSERLRASFINKLLLLAASN